MSDSFLNYRKKQEEQHLSKIDSNDPINSLISVEINTTELCNRKCVFCPRIDPKIFPNRDLHMSIETIEKIGNDLSDFDYKGRISFSGFGESLLYEHFTDAINSLRDKLPSNHIETNTNGDKLNPDVIKALFNSGLSALYVNMYDGPHQEQQFHDMFKEAEITTDQYVLREHWSGPDNDFSLKLNNRSGTLQNEAIGIVELTEPLKKVCYYPFYKMLIDWDGRVLFCSNDWGREIVVGSVLESSIKDLWLSDIILDIRRRLAMGDRLKSPCNKCDIDGQLHGSTSFKILTEHYSLPVLD